MNNCEFFKTNTLNRQKNCSFDSFEAQLSNQLLPHVRCGDTLYLQVNRYKACSFSIGFIKSLQKFLNAT